MDQSGERRLALGQRIVVVVALGFVLAVFGTYVTSLGTSPKLSPSAIRFDASQGVQDGEAATSRSLTDRLMYRLASGPTGVWESALEDRELKSAVGTTVPRKRLRQLRPRRISQFGRLWRTPVRRSP